ncbi:SUKH-4 family immunity protein [Kitasatospora sp. NPDC004723]|uniref:SUKH-4 family immunity protein n=1 Tax=Kitasatospora sp. NPDC004723 TaxID=3154288 RepID=UPI00339FAAA3
MVTYAQAHELAEEWINGGVLRERQREVRVREFDLGFVCWAVQPGDGAAPAEGEARLVIARDSGASTLWPALPVNEVVRQYEEAYGRPVAANPAGAARPAPGPVEATSFLLSPPQWLQEAGEAALAAEAERLGTGAPDAEPAADRAVDRAADRGGAPAVPPVAPPVPPAPPAAPVVPPVVPPAAVPGAAVTPAAVTPAAVTPAAPGAAPVAPEYGELPAPAVLTTPPVSERPAGDAPTMLAPPPGHREPAAAPAPRAEVEAATVLLPDGLRTNGAGLPGEPRAGSEAATVLLPEGGLPGLAGLPGAPGGPGTPAPGTPVPPQGVPVPPQAAAVEPAPTLLAPPDGPPGMAGLPGAPGAPVPPPAAPSVEHAPTMLASPDGLPGLAGLPGAPAPGAPVPSPADAPAGGRNPASAPPPPPPAGLLGGPSGPGAGSAPVGLGRNPASAPPPPPPADLLGGSGPAPAASGGRSASSAPPPPPPAGLRPGDAPPAPPAAPVPGAGVAYERTQLAGAVDPAQLGAPADPGTPPSGGPAVPPPPGAGAPVDAPGAGYGYPGGPAPVGPPAPAPAPAAPPAPVPVPGPPPAAPVPPGVPAVGPGYFAALSYRGPDGSEQKLLHRSEPGTPHPEWKILQDLRRLNVPPEQVLELYTELESCDLPGGYCNRMIAASWPNVRLTHTADYGRDHHSRQAGMAQLLDHLDELHQLASGQQRVRPFRVPLPAPGTVPPLPPLAPQQLASELGQAFGPNVFRFEQRAVARQGVPEPVAQTLMWAGLPREFGPFFWAQAQEGRPIPTLAELAAERGLPGGPDFGGYLVLGNDYGRQLCVQYGTAHVVAVDLEGTGEPPRFVNTGVPEFARSLALLGRMWRLRYGLTPDQAGRWTTDFQAQLAAIDPAALQSADTWWAVLLEQFWDGLL